MSKAEKFETAEIPFIVIGNQRCLTSKQVFTDKTVADFVERFKSSFEYDLHFDIYRLKEKSPSPNQSDHIGGR
jgi:hypothetical protein